MATGCDILLYDERDGIFRSTAAAGEWQRTAVEKRAYCASEEDKAVYARKVMESRTPLIVEGSKDHPLCTRAGQPGKQAGRQIPDRAPAAGEGPVPGHDDHRLDHGPAQAGRPRHGYPLCAGKACRSDDRAGRRQASRPQAQSHRRQPGDKHSKSAPDKNAYFFIFLLTIIMYGKAYRISDRGPCGPVRHAVPVRRHAGEDGEGRQPRDLRIGLRGEPGRGHEGGESAGLRDHVPGPGRRRNPERHPDHTQDRRAHPVGEAGHRDHPPAHGLQPGPPGTVPGRPWRLPAVRASAK